VELPVSHLTPPSAPGPSNPAALPTLPTTSTAPVASLRKENKKKHHLTTLTDPLFAELRDLNFSSVGKKLNRVAHRLDEDYKVGPLLRHILTKHVDYLRPVSKPKRLRNYEVSSVNCSLYGFVSINNCLSKENFLTWE
jgi:hypothetical protein